MTVCTEVTSTTQMHVKSSHTHALRMRFMILPSTSGGRMNQRAMEKRIDANDARSDSAVSKSAGGYAHAKIIPSARLRKVSA